MPVRLELDKDTTRAALEAYLASIKRAMNSAKNPAFKPIYEKDMAALQTAINTITDTK